MANPSNMPKVPRSGTVSLFDVAGYSGGNRLDWPYIHEHSGNLGAKPEPVYSRVRGKWKATQEGDDPIISVTFAVEFTEFTNELQETFCDACDGRGLIGGTWTKNLATIAHWNLGIRFTAAGTIYGDLSDHYWQALGAVLTWDLAESTNTTTKLNVTATIADFDNITFSGPA